eukprot:145219-Pelagomonas_calceolata.AAC.3
MSLHLAAHQGVVVQACCQGHALRLHQLHDLGVAPGHDQRWRPIYEGLKGRRRLQGRVRLQEQTEPDIRQLFPFNAYKAVQVGSLKLVYWCRAPTNFQACCAKDKSRETMSTDKTCSKREKKKQNRANRKESY